jgi:thioredoxin reductase
MEYEGGWERGYTQAIKEVTDKPVLLVGRITDPAVAEELLASQEADAILLARQMFADPEWANKARSGHDHDIRRCVAANYCWRSVIRGGRVQCVYNPTVGRERRWGAGTLRPASATRRVLVIGGGPAGLEYARVASACGHEVTLLEREQRFGGHTRAYAALPHRSQYGFIGDWLAEQAEQNGATLRASSPVDETSMDRLLDEVQPDHVVVATGARFHRDGFQGQTAQPIPGWETGDCVTWDEVALGRVKPTGQVVVIDDIQDVAAPLTAVAISEYAEQVTLVTRWPMVAMETAPDVYLHWMLTYLYQTGVEMLRDHLVTRIDGDTVSAINVYHQEAVRELAADCIVMATGRRSENSLYHLLRDRGASVETIGDATAPRGTYEATFEGHRQARKL